MPVVVVASSKGGAGKSTTSILLGTELAQAGANVTVTATATDPDGTIASVQFFANGNPIGTATASPSEGEAADGESGGHR